MAMIQLLMFAKKLEPLETMTTVRCMVPVQPVKATVMVTLSSQIGLTCVNDVGANYGWL